MDRIIAFNSRYAGTLSWRHAHTVTCRASYSERMKEQDKHVVYYLSRFSVSDFDDFYGIACKVVNAMVAGA